MVTFAVSMPKAFKTEGRITFWGSSATSEQIQRHIDGVEPFKCVNDFQHYPRLLIAGDLLLLTDGSVARFEGFGPEKWSLHEMYVPEAFLAQHRTWLESYVPRWVPPKSVGIVTLAGSAGSGNTVTYGALTHDATFLNAFRDEVNVYLFYQEWNQMFVFGGNAIKLITLDGTEWLVQPQHSHYRFTRVTPLADGVVEAFLQAHAA